MLRFLCWQFFLSLKLTTMAQLADMTLPFSDADLDGWLSAAGLRRTVATRAVLRLFVTHPAWLPTHAEVEAVLQQQGVEVNRVTLYRLLDRLASVGLLARHVDEVTRAWRFALAASGSVDAERDASGVVPRFECDACHRQFRLTDASPPTQAVADQLLKTLASLGHQGQRVDLSIHGTCNVCVEPASVGKQASG